MDEEKRKFPRTTAVLKVEYDSESGVAADYLTDLSDGGLFIHTSLAFPVGEAVHFSLSFPGLLDPMQMSGIVRWRKNASGDQDKGMGVQFVYPDEGSKKVIQDLVRKFITQMQAPPMSLPAFRILLVDDNPVVLALFTRALKRLRRGADDSFPGPEIITATGGCQALKLLESEHLDLAILDNYLPEIDGLSLVRVVRKDPNLAHLPVVMISSDEDERLRKAAMDIGVDLFLVKPLQANALLATLAVLING